MIVEVQSWGALPRDHLRAGDLSEHPVGEEAVLGEGFDLEQTPVGGEAGGPQGGQILQCATDTEVMRVVDRGFGA